MSTKYEYLITKSYVFLIGASHILASKYSATLTCAL